MFDKYPDVLTVEQVAEALSIGRNTAYSLVRNSSIRCIKVGKKYLIPKIFLIEFVKAYR